MMRRLVLALSALVLIASACSDDGEAGPDPDPTTPAAEADTGDSEPEETPDPADEADPEAEEPSAPVAFRFTVEGVPPTVAELVLIVDDPDAPTESPFVHWLVYGIDPSTTEVTDGDPALTYGTTDANLQSWFGPCPPPGDGLHAYIWRLFGVSAPLDLEPGLDARSVEAAIDGLIVAESTLIASYERPA